MTMEIVSLATFKEVRNQAGTPTAVYYMLNNAGLDEERIESFCTDLMEDLGGRFIEKMKAKDLYAYIDGYLLALQEFDISRFN